MRLNFLLCFLFSALGRVVYDIRYESRAPLDTDTGYFFVLVLWKWKHDLISFGVGAYRFFNFNYIGFTI